MRVDVWLYGQLSYYCKEKAEKGFARVEMDLPDGTTVGELLQEFGIPSNERGITFLNGNLNALPGLQPDKDQPLKDGDQISFFDQRSMWPFQYRHGAAMSDELNTILNTDPEAIMRHQHNED